MAPISNRDASIAVSARVFRAISIVDVETISVCGDAELRPILACLVRMSLIAPLDQSPACLLGRTSVLQVLSRIDLVNSIVALLSIDFHALEIDVKKEQQLRQKLECKADDSVLISNLASGPSQEFERSDCTRKLRLVLSELLAIMATTDRKEEGKQEKIVEKPSELFDHKVYLHEVCDVLAIALAELPALLQPQAVAEALLRLKYGPEIICHIVANQSDCFYDVACHLLRNGDRHEDEDGGSVRQDALLLLCRMNPAQSLAVRAKAVELCKMPGLAILLTLEHGMENPKDSDTVVFLSGLLLGGDQQQRSWITLFIRNGQKRRCEALTQLRAELTRRLSGILSKCGEKKLPASLVLETSAILRLYTALRSIAGMKFSEEEVSLLMELITRQPPASPAGVKLVSIGLSMLIACNTLIAQQGLEKLATDWIRWLVREEAYFEAESGCAASFGEMLLLIAIHFHAGQLTAIADLVCQALGMKIAVKTNTMTRMKQIFTNDIFTESTVAAHAVKVPVTPNLSGHVQGFLPVHCIHQLLKSRVFSKHRVSIKSWIYNQICRAASPLHPVLPQLIEVYVQSILVPSTNRSSHSDHFNQALTEAEIKKVFSKVVIDDLSTCTTPGRASSSSSSRPLSHTRFSTSPTKSQNRSRAERTAEDNVCVQICILYYILLYEDVRLANMRNILATGRQVTKYSADLLAELPVKFLLSAAESQQGQFEGMFPSLLRLCSTHFPHLCLVEDWLRSEPSCGGASGSVMRRPPNPHVLRTALSNVTTCPAQAVLALRNLRDCGASETWELADILVSNIQSVLGEDVPRQVQDLYRNVWLNLNSVYPRKLWLLTVNNLRLKESVVSRNLTQEELSLDPLSVLRCDERVFRSGPILSIVLYMLKACLAASRTRLSQHLLEQPATGQPGQIGDMEKEELKNALVLTQESAAIQILLECCLPTREEKARGSRLSALQEIQSLVCCYLHEAFIADPNLAKLVHFQGYPLELLAVTVAGVPSMHICLDFAPELLSQPSLEKQVFAVDLVSQLSVQYSLPKSLSTARLAMNSVSTLLSVLASQSREELILSVLPSLSRFCLAFPPLLEDVMSLLLQAGRICLSTTSLQGYASPTNYDMTRDADKSEFPELSGVVARLPASHPVADEITKTFQTILQQTVLAKKIF